LQRSVQDDSDQSKVYQVAADYVASMRRAIDEAAALSERSKLMAKLGPAAIRTKADLESRRAILREALRVCASILWLIDGAPGRFRDGLVRAGVKPELVKKGVLELSQSLSRVGPELRQLFAAEESVRTSAMEWLDLLEAQWGKWRVVRGLVVFDSPTAIARQRQIFERMEKAAAALHDLEAQHWNSHP
jgi:hypothetical protein